MLSPKEFRVLLDLLSENRPFEELGQTLVRSFSSSSSGGGGGKSNNNVLLPRLDICQTIYLLFQEETLLVSSRLVGLYFMYYLYKKRGKGPSIVSHHPFMDIFQSFLRDGKENFGENSQMVPATTTPSGRGKGKKGKKDKGASGTGAVSLTKFTEEQFFLTKLMTNAHEIDRHTPHQTLANYLRFVKTDQPLVIPLFPSLTTPPSSASRSSSSGTSESKNRSSPFPTPPPPISPTPSPPLSSPSSPSSTSSVPHTPIQIFHSDSPTFANVNHVYVSGRLSFPQSKQSSTQPTSERAKSVGRLFAPPFATIAPPLLRPRDSELEWLDLTLHPSLVWDDTQVDAAPSLTAEEDEIILLIDEAANGPLLPKLTHKLLLGIEKNPLLVSQSSLRPLVLPKLIEHNPVIAVQVILSFINQPDTIVLYFAELINMDMSLHSMEVVNRLARSVELPPEFLNIYITQCLSQCQLRKDRYQQLRMVRLLCIFLQSLIQTNLWDVSNLLVEVSTFCIEYSKTKEASDLFALLKKMEKEGLISELKVD
eukprot:TRINITY_DN1916_c0_g1_i1.p1 TRINITY_DN1916_c0_g1~~TRINITY_DN1916_c0_g1_i1.p1  ORF type:complete len:537 (+),score=113.55 TRINITY_DN1916_c0_g1_i1:88-1698(+)